jgi:hypothetical protein
MHFVKNLLVTIKKEPKLTVVAWGVKTISSLP